MLKLISLAIGLFLSVTSFAAEHPGAQAIRYYWAR